MLGIRGFVENRAFGPLSHAHSFLQDFGSQISFLKLCSGGGAGFPSLTLPEAGVVSVSRTSVRLRGGSGQERHTGLSYYFQSCMDTVFETNIYPFPEENLVIRRACGKTRSLVSMDRRRVCAIVRTSLLRAFALPSVKI